jgi:hypothetical protein
MPTYSRVRRKQGPAIAWSPIHEAYYVLARVLRSAASAPPLYLTQAAILGFEAHLRESASPLPFGLLSGDLCLNPDTKQEYLLIDTVSRARIELSEDDPQSQLAAELVSLATEQGKQRKLPIGWYIGGMGDELTLDSELASLHRELFPEPWQLVLLRGAHAGSEQGAFLRFDVLAGRTYSIPFYEFLPGRKSGERRTALRWVTYRADEPALPLDQLEASKRTAAIAPPSRRSPWSVSTSIEALRRALRERERKSKPREPERPKAPLAPLAAGVPAAAPAAIRSTAPPPVATATPSYPETQKVQPSSPPVGEPSKPPVGEPSKAQEIEPPPERAPDPLLVEPVAAQSTPAADLHDHTAEAPASDVQHIFIDGILVAVPTAYEITPDNGMFAGVERDKLTRVFMVPLVLLVLVALYLIAR